MLLASLPRFHSVPSRRLSACILPRADPPGLSVASRLTGSCSCDPLQALGLPTSSNASIFDFAFSTILEFGGSRFPRIRYTRWSMYYLASVSVSYRNEVGLLVKRVACGAGGVGSTPVVIHPNLAHSSAVQFRGSIRFAHLPTPFPASSCTNFWGIPDRLRALPPWPTIRLFYHSPSFYDYGRYIASPAFIVDYFSPEIYTIFLSIVLSLKATRLRYDALPMVVHLRYRSGYEYYVFFTFAGFVLGYFGHLGISPTR